MTPIENFIYLSVCAASRARARLDEVDFDALWDIAANHNMTALVAKALSDTKAYENAPHEEKERWRNALDNSVKKNMLFNSERKRISDFMEQNGIWHIPLKGAVINGLYPHFGTREFADNDILYDGGFRDTVDGYLVSRGYEHQDDEYVAEAYIKPPFFNFEMHTALFRPDNEDDYCLTFYREMLNRKLPEKGRQFTFRMTDDDFYIYFIVHAHKHYDNKGTGFRTLVDEYVILNSGRFNISFPRVESELDKLGIREFERRLRDLCAKLFDDNPENVPKTLEKLEGAERQMLGFILSSGTFGKMSNIYIKEFAESGNGDPPSKGKYFLKRIFPPPSRFRYSNPFVYKHKAVYPFFLVYRMAVKPIKHRKYIRQELSAIKKAEKNS